MKDKWGLSLSHRVQSGRLEVVVKKVGKFSPAAKTGMKEGNIVTQINEWKIEAMDNVQVALNIFMAAGYSVTIGWINTQEQLDDWINIEPI